MKEVGNDETKKSSAFFDLARELYTHIDEETGEKTTNMELVNSARAYREQTGKAPWEVTIQGKSLAEFADAGNVSLDEAAAAFRERLFHVPSGSITAAEDYMRVSKASSLFKVGNQRQGTLGVE